MVSPLRRSDVLHRGALLVAALLSACVPSDRAPLDLADGAPRGVARAIESEFGELDGQIVSEGGSWVPGVRVTLGAVSATTDDRGLFHLAPLPPGTGVLRASRPGWSSTGQRVEVAAGSRLRLQVMMVPANRVTLAAASAGPSCVLQTGDGVRVVFTEGAFRDDDGGIVTGALVADVTLLRGSSRVAAAPGAMRALLDGAEVGLESFGMVEVALSQAGRPITFLGTAELSFPLPDDTILADGETIPLWSFDAATGWWQLEGEGEVQGGRFVADVPHFSWWNADRPLVERSCVRGVLHAPSGAPAAGFQVHAAGLDHLGLSGGLSGPDGAFCVPVKRGGRVRVGAGGGNANALWSWEADATAGTAPATCGSGCVELGDVSFADLTDDLDGDGFTELAGDCDDGNPAVSPGGADAATNGQDDDCDGLDGPDADDDGAADAATGGLDCDDADPGVRPTATERCNGRDDDCDGDVDEGGTPDGLLAFADADGDGAGDPSQTTVVCAPVVGWVFDGLDCDDADPLVAPSMPERCLHPLRGAGVDEDCDGRIDPSDALGAATFFLDADGDGFGDPGTPVLGCLRPADAVTDATDCDDGRAAAFPAALEVCNGVDDDCDASLDEPGAWGEATFFLDDDGDGWGLAAQTWIACALPFGAALLPGDCDDASPLVFPGAPESCVDNEDRNCDGAALFEDLDGDSVPACLDCDDLDGASAPGNSESCDSLDSDCDGSLVDFYADTDGDGFPDCLDPDDDGDGDPDGSDCAPLDPAARAGAPEQCDGVDSDCDGSLVDGAADNDSDGLPDCLDPDDDGDGSPDGADCEPLLGAVFPGAPELCDGLDNDCDGTPDTCGGFLADAVIYGAAAGWNLGAALAAGDLDGDGLGDLVIGSPGAGSALGTGAIHVFPGLLAGGVPASAASAVVQGQTAEDWAGASIASNCDLDDDGVDDLVVGAWGQDGAGTSSGAVYVVYGPISGAVSLAAADAILFGESAGDWAGWSVACAGDTDGDGNDDVLVGAHRDDDGGFDAGAAYLLLGPVAPGVAGLASRAASKLTGEGPFDFAGASVAGAGDVDGDGFADVLVGAWGRDEAGSAAGIAYLVRGPIPATLSLATADARVLGAAAGDRAGALVAGAGDLDGDGRSDVLIGAWGADSAGENSGAAYVFYGPLAGDLSVTEADRVILGVAAGDQLGAAGAGAGDANGDGYGDLLLGAPGRDTALLDVGAAFLLLGGPAGPAPLGAPLMVGSGANDGAGSAVAAAGDTDGDGFDDVLVGLPGADTQAGDVGAAALLRGPAP